MTHLIARLPLTNVGEVVNSMFKALNRSLFKAAEQRATQQLRNYKKYRDTVDELQGLSDKSLKDIGINRGMIHSVALDALSKEVSK